MRPSAREMGEPFEIGEGEEVCGDDFAMTSGLGALVVMGWGAVGWGVGESVSEEKEDVVGMVPAEQPPPL